MKSKRFLLGALVLVLAFGMTVIGCPTDDGDSDSWSAVTSLDQLNGTWKGSYSETMPVGEYYPIPNAEQTVGNMEVTMTIEMTMTINASAKTQTLTSKTTITFKGGKINEMWPMIKGLLEEEMGEEEEGVTVSINDSAHSITTTSIMPTETLTDAAIAEAIKDLQINQSGNKVKTKMGDDDDDYAREIIFTKQ
jgi:hypothetical protein